MDINEKNDGLLPPEWMALVKEAMDSNITKNQFKEFLKQKSLEHKDIINSKKTLESRF
ncbi:anti-repressor SinI family protein [Priestia megaterium]